MKKILLICGVMLLGSNYASAQSDSNLFNHLGIGVGIGTTGITLDASTTVGHYVGIRAGVDLVPGVKYSTDLDIESSAADRQAAQLAGYTIPEKISVEGKLSMTTGHVLVDVFPFRSSSFRLTAGAYFGGSKIVNVYNKDDKDLADIVSYNATVPSYGGVLSPIGVQLGDYFLSPYSTADGGRVEANIKVSSFRPYLGLGFGRSVPQKSRVTCQFDMGVQFWGTPKVYMVGANGEDELTKKDANGKDGGFIKTLSKITAYPCLSFRIVGRIF
jgi:hypothetical protein